MDVRDRVFYRLSFFRSQKHDRTIVHPGSLFFRIDHGTSPPCIKKMDPLEEMNEAGIAGDVEGGSIEDNSKKKGGMRCGSCGVMGHRKTKCPTHPYVPPRKKKKNDGIVVHESTLLPQPPPESVPYDPTTTRMGVVLHEREGVGALKEAPATPPTRQHPGTQQVTHYQSPTRNLRNENVLYFLFDLETTGFGSYSDIVEVAMIVVNNLKEVISHNPFHELVKPAKMILPQASKVHGHTSQSLQDKPLFNIVGERLLRYMNHFLDNNTKVGILTAHNASFDVPVLINSLSRVGMKLPERITMSCDTLKVVRNMFSRAGNQQVIPNKLNLNAIYKHFFQEDIQNAHTARGDVYALLL